MAAEQKRSHLARLWSAYLILAILLLASAGTFGWTRRQVHARLHARFDQGVMKYRNAIEKHFAHCEMIVRGLKAFVDASERITPEEFHRYVVSMGLHQKHPGIFDVGYLVAVRADEWPAHLDYARKLGFQNYQPFAIPEPSDNLLVFYLDDFSGRDVRSIGWNVARNPTRNAAIQKARATGRLAATEGIRLYTGDTNNMPVGFILYAPIFHKPSPSEGADQTGSRLASLVFASFSDSDFWSEIKRQAGEPGVDFRIFEGNRISRTTLRYPAIGQEVGHWQSLTDPTHFSQELTFVSMEREWLFQFLPTEAFGPGPEGSLPWLLLGLGLAVSLGIFGLVVLQANRRLQAERWMAELQASRDAQAAEKERLAVTLRSIGDGVIAADTAGIVRLMNPIAERFTGWSQDRAVGQALIEVFQIRDATTGQSIACPLAQVLEQGNIHQAVQPVTLSAPTGGDRLIMYSAAPIRDSSGHIIGVIVVFRDFTERQKLLDEQIKSSKLESLGLLAGGIAHDFNNLLSTILGNISLAHLDIGSNPELKSWLADAEKACGRARDLTQQLLTFARGGAPIRQSEHLDHILQDSARFATTGSNVRCQLSLPPDLWPVDVDRGQIAQVVHNLVINAMHAMPEGGTVSLEAENLVLVANNSLGLAPGRYVKFSVIDHGCGIPPEHLSSIFDPYFTTKPHGSGLGLTSAHSIVKRHQGTIDVRSSPGKGACFEVVLPCSNQPPAPPPPHPTPVLGEKGLVLIMDDEPAVLAMLRSILKRLGFSVLTSQDGAETVRQFRELQAQQETVRAIILDLTVPAGLGGKETVKELLALDPKAKVIVSSGYSMDPIMANYRDYGFTAVMTKPYSVDELVAALHQATTAPMVPSK